MINMIAMFALFVENTNNTSASALRLLTDPSERCAGIPKTIQNKKTNVPNRNEYF
jgi:hypothetical protein